MKTVYLVRHGEAQHNVVPPPEFFVGAESALTEQGHAQARFIAERASHLEIDALISSTMRRARETARYVGEAIGAEAELSDLFVEYLHPKSLEGKRWLDPEVQDIQRRWEKTFFSAERVLDGENYADIAARAGRAMRYLEERPESHIMIVTHGLFMRALVSRCIHGERLTPEIAEAMAWGMRTRNTGLTILKHNPQDPERAWHLWVWNDQAHLAE